MRFPVARRVLAGLAIRPACVIAALDRTLGSRPCESHPGIGVPCLQVDAAAGQYSTHRCLVAGPIGGIDSGPASQADAIDDASPRICRLFSP